MDASVQQQVRQQSGLPRAVVVVGSALVGFVLVVGIVGAMANRAPTLLAPDTPEGSFQRYLLAFEAGDYEDAYSHFSSRAQQQMSLARFRHAADEQRRWSDVSQRMTLDSAYATGERATLTLVVLEGGGGLFGDAWEYTESVRLVRAGDTWLIDEPLLGISPYYDWDYEFDY